MSCIVSPECCCDTPHFSYPKWPNKSSRAHSACLPLISHLTCLLVFWRQLNFFVKIITSCQGLWIRRLWPYIPAIESISRVSLSPFTPARQCQCVQSSVRHTEWGLLKLMTWVGTLLCGEGLIYNKEDHKSKGSSVRHNLRVLRIP